MRKLYKFLCVFVVFPVFAFSATDRTISEIIESIMSPITSFLESVIFVNIPIGSYQIPFVLVLLMSGAMFFTIYLRFINIRGFRHAIDVVRGKYDNLKDKGDVNHFQALTTALSGTVGVGNIAGVAVAISLGGAGATFWMIVAGMLGMASKFAECTLGLKYRIQNADGEVSGGPMYYLTGGLAKMKFPKLGKLLAVLFAIACIGGSFGGGNMVQVNQATEQLISVLGGQDTFLYGKGWIFGIVMAIVVGIVIIGGIKSIARVTDKVVPFMVAIYLFGVVFVLLYHFADIPVAFGQIVQGAFTKNAAFGGFIGVLIQGFRRSAFSNEAGIGSASIAHSAAKTNEPVSEGVVALLEPFIDTVIICTMTALVIIITGNVPSQLTEITGEEAIGLTSRSFESVISWFPHVLSLAVILFALSTMVSWSYYGLKAWTYLFGESKKSGNIYKLIFCLFIVVGSSISAQSVFNFGDAMIFAMCFPNMIGLFMLSKELKADTNSYFKRVKSGDIKKYK